MGTVPILFVPILLLFQSTSEPRIGDRHVEKHPLTDPAIFLVSLKATAHLELKETDRAIAAYESTLPVIRKRHNVGQRRFASIFFTLGALYHETGNGKKAISLLEEGLALEPQNIPVQILMGEYYAEAGKREQATSHYRELLDGPGLKEEEGVVIRTKLRRLGAAAAEIPFPYRSWCGNRSTKGLRSGSFRSTGAIRRSRSKTSVPCWRANFLSGANCSSRWRSMKRASSTRPETSMTAPGSSIFSNNRIQTRKATSYPRISKHDREPPRPVRAGPASRHRAGLQ